MMQSKKKQYLADITYLYIEEPLETIFQKEQLWQRSLSSQKNSEKRGGNWGGKKKVPAPIENQLLLK